MKSENEKMKEKGIAGIQNKQKKTATPSSPRKCRVWTYR